MPNTLTVSKEISPAQSLELLKQGNQRFTRNMKINRDYLGLVNETKDGQNPFACILSCMDSRAPAETIFDQGLGDIFSIRIAGNVITDYILGSLEFATAVAGSKLVVVMGHTNCGAVKGACDDVKLGNLTQLLDKIKPAVEMEKTFTENRTSANLEFVNTVAAHNVKHAMSSMLEQSPIIRDLVESKEIGLVPAMYDVSTGVVTFYEEDAII